MLVSERLPIQPQFQSSEIIVESRRLNYGPWNYIKFPFVQLCDEIVASFFLYDSLELLLESIIVTTVSLTVNRIM
jgi:hypothetical protein